MGPLSVFQKPLNMLNKHDKRVYSNNGVKIAQQKADIEKEKIQLKQQKIQQQMQKQEFKAQERMQKIQNQQIQNQNKDMQNQQQQNQQNQQQQLTQQANMQNQAVAEEMFLNGYYDALYDILNENAALVAGVGALATKMNSDINKSIQNSDKLRYSNNGVKIAQINQQNKDRQMQLKELQAQQKIQKQQLNAQLKMQKMQNAQNTTLKVGNFSLSNSTNQQPMQVANEAFLEGYYDALNDIGKEVEIEDVFKNFEDEYGKDDTTELTTFKDMRQKDGFASRSHDYPNLFKRVHDRDMNLNPNRFKKMNYLK